MMHIYILGTITVTPWLQPSPNPAATSRKLGAAGVVQQELLSTESLHHPMEPNDLTRRDLGRDDLEGFTPHLMAT